MLVLNFGTNIYKESFSKRCHHIFEHHLHFFYGCPFGITSDYFSFNIKYSFNDIRLFSSTNMKYVTLDVICYFVNNHPKIDTWG